ncbi:11045_t:CDS:2 [Ambispora gerdemannii]|uniref:11045_t:CDS:1 n=1 Tax=Ambispora gerdemannii TaxID=144530 RepID=A0A9N9DXB6_9GLOM|nr:11045_t:CDS:2 [Ambispora gerdemannii]
MTTSRSPVPGPSNWTARGRQPTRQNNSGQTTPRTRSLSNTSSQTTARVTEHEQSRIITDETDELNEDTPRLYWDRSTTQ